MLGMCASLLAGSVLAEEPEDQYVPIYLMMQQAEELEQAGSGTTALVKFREAQAQLDKLQTAFPLWNAKLVSFRQRYVTAKISSLEKQYPGVGLPAASTITNAPVPVAVNVQAQVDELRNQLRQALADREILQGKLREALSVQPAASDPRELAKADEQIRQLQKTNDLLQVALTQEKMRAAKMVGTEQIGEFQKSVEDLRKKLAGQMEIADALAKEKEALQKQVRGKSGAVGKTNEAALKSLQNELAAANRQLESQERANLELAKKNEVLKKQLQERQTTAPDARELKKAQDILAETQRKLELQSQLAADYLKEKSGLEKQVRDTESRLVKMADPDDLKAAQSALAETKAKLKRQIYLADEFAMQKAGLQEKLTILEKEKEILQKKVKNQD